MEFEMSKSTMNKAKRLDKQIGESFKEYQERKRLAAEAALNESEAMRNKVLNAQAQKFERAREHERAAKKSMFYEDTINVVGLTEMLTRVVEESLLLDLDEYKALNENYHSFIRGTINDFLSKAEINGSIDNENTMGLYECVQANKPSRDVGVYLTEEELQDEYGNLPYHVGEDYINALGGDVMDRVATMIDADQKTAAEIDGNLNAIVGFEESAMIRNEQPGKTVLEVLALNEANQMVSEGKEYSADLALANAITYITILETLDASGLVKVGKDGYRNILEAAGVKSTPKTVGSKKAVILTEKQSAEVKENVYQYTSKVEEARHAGVKSFAEWKKEKALLTEQVSDVKVEKSYDYERNGKKYTEGEVRSLLESNGFDFEIDEFADAAYMYGFKKI